MTQASPKPDVAEIAGTTVVRSVLLCTTALATCSLGLDKMIALAATTKETGDD